MPKKKCRVTIDLEEQEYELLTLLKNKLDRSISWLGRKAICDFINRERPSSSKHFEQATAPEENT